MIFSAVCSALYETRRLETFVRSFPHLRPCKSRQPRGTNKRQSEVLGKKLLEQHEAGYRNKARQGKTGKEKKRDKCQKLVKTRCLTSATTGLCTWQIQNVRFPPLRKLRVCRPTADPNFTSAESAACSQICRQSICAGKFSLRSPYNQGKNRNHLIHCDL